MISPRSTVKVSEYIKQRLASNKLYDLVVAGRAAPGNGEVLSGSPPSPGTRNLRKGSRSVRAAAPVGSGRRRRRRSRQLHPPPPAPASDTAEAEFARGEALRKAGGEKNEREALACYQRAVELGHVPAMHRIGVMFAKGWGVQQDDAKAVEWYRKAADKGLAEAQYDLGVRYIKGLGVARDESTGLELCRKAAAQGWQDAIDMLREREKAARHK